MHIQTYNHRYLDAMIRLWNENLPHYPVKMEDIAVILFCDDNYDDASVFMAVDQGRLLGFCIGLKRKYPFLEKGLQEGQGWILNIVVEKSHRRKGIGSALFIKMEEALACPYIQLASYSPYYFFAGVDREYQEAIAFFEHHQYQRKETVYSMELDLIKYHTPHEIEIRKRSMEKEGYTFSAFTWQDGKELLDFLNMHFSTGWRYHAIMAMRKKTAADTIVLCRKHGAVIGYVQCAIDGDKTRYGPFGVDPSLRSQGIGSVLVHEMWKLMQSHGAKRAWFHSTDAAGKRFYERHGMRIIHSLYHYEKGGES